MKKISVCLAVFIMGAVCVACTKGSSTQNVADRVTESESVSEQPTTEAEASKEQTTESETETQNEAPDETETPFEDVEKYELNTVESLEDDGKEMSAAEALRSTMKGKHSALELTKDNRLYTLTKGWGFPNVEEIKDMPDTGLARINMLNYNRTGLIGGITPIAMKWGDFVCVDLDQNGTKEVLIYGGNIGAALHYAGGEVYITVIPIRSFPINVYENGVCDQSAGSAWSFGQDRYYPAKGAMYHENLAYREEGHPNINADYYEINNRAETKYVTKEEYDAYVDELIGGLTPLEWHEFTEENIDRYVVD